MTILRNWAAQNILIEVPINGVEEQIKEIEAQRLQASIDLEKLRQAKVRVKNLEKSFKEEQKSIDLELEGFDVSIDDLLKVTVSYEKIDEIISALVQQGEIAQIQLEGDGVEEDSGLRNILKNKLDLKAELLSKLGAPEKQYQKYLSEYSEWKKKRDSIVGDPTDVTTLSGLESILQYIDEEMQGDVDSLRAERSEYVREIYNTKSRLVDIYKNIKESIDESLSENHDLLGKYNVVIKSCFEFDEGFYTRFQSFINQNKKGSFYGKDSGLLKFKGLTEPVDLSNIDSLLGFLDVVISHLETDYRDINKKQDRYIDDQVKDMSGLYDYLFSLDYLTEAYSLEMGGKQLQQLSPGEKGALLLIFYLVLDKDNKPLVIDQPEDNLDNQSVSRILVPFIKKAKLRRQIFMVTHNPNLAVVADAEQVIHINIDKEKDSRVTAKPGAIESLEINRSIVDILEGTMPAFRQRDNKYM